MLPRPDLDTAPGSITPRVPEHAKIAGPRIATRVAPILVAIVMVLAVAACGGKASPGPNPGSNAGSNTSLPYQDMLHAIGNDVTRIDGTCPSSSYSCYQAFEDGQLDIDGTWGPDHYSWPSDVANDLNSLANSEEGHDVGSVDNAWARLKSDATSDS